MVAKVFELVPQANYYKQRTLVIEGETVLHRLSTEGNRFVANMVIMRYDVAEKERMIDDRVRIGWLDSAV